MTFDVEAEVWGKHFPDIQIGRDREPLGPSAVGGCYRQQAYAQLGAPVSNPEDTAKADAGSLYHYGIQQIVRSPQVRTEYPITIPGLRRKGSGDIVVISEHLLVDIKTYGDRAFNTRLTKGGPYPDQWDQCELYGLGLHEMAQDGEPWTLQILAINRDTGEHVLWEKVQDLDRGWDLARKLEQRQDAISAAAAGMDLTGEDPVVVAERFPREGKGPGRGMPCDWCPFLDLCWPVPDDPTLTPQSAAIVDDPEAIAMAAANYRIGADLEAEGKRIKYDAQAALRGITGTFGEWAVRQSRPSRDSEVPDADAMLDRLTELGEPIPMLVKPGRAGYPIVSRAKGVQ